MPTAGSRMPNNPMRRRATFLACVILAAMLVPLPAANQERASPRRGAIRHVILVSIDGLPPAAYLDPDKYGLKVPTLREMARSGAVSDGAQSVFPTLTYPAHTSIATGANPGTHGIVTNETLDPEERNDRGWRWYAQDIRVPTLWDAARARGLRTALVGWPVTVGARAKSLVPEYWRAGTAEDVKLLKVLATPGLLDKVAARSPGFWEGYTPPGIKDARYADIATYLIETERPHLLMLHIFEVDHWQHRKGPFSPEAKAAIENADAQLARLIAAAKKAGIWQRTALVVVSDHGVAPFQTRFRPGVHMAQRGLVTLDERGRVTDWRAAILPGHGIAYVYLKDANDAQTLHEAREVFEPLVGKEGSGIARIYSPEEIRALGGDRQAAFALGAQEGYDFSSGYSGDVFLPVGTSVAGHGYDPRLPSMQASLLMFGPAIAPGKIGHARLLDVAPTVASWLELRMTGMEGKALAARPGTTPR